MRKSAVVAYKLLKANVGKPVTPAALEAAMNVGPYAGRDVWILKKRLGLNIITQKDGRTVVSYTMVEVPKPEPAQITEYFAKARKAKAKTAVATVPVPVPAAEPVPEKPKKAVKKKNTTKAEEVTINLDAAEVGGGEFSIDAEFDAVETGDLPDFLQPEVVE